MSDEMKAADATADQRLRVMLEPDGLLLTETREIGRVWITNAAGGGVANFAISARVIWPGDAPTDREKELVGDLIEVLRVTMRTVIERIPASDVFEDGGAKA